MPDPRTVLEERLTARRTAVAALARRDARIALARLVAFGALVAAAVARYALHRLDGTWMLLPAAAFVALLVLHDRALRALARARRAVAFHEDALRRLDGSWAGTGDAGDRHASAEHPYALDLDLFGKGSLFELLCTARTLGGADLLASWLLAPPPSAGEVRARQEAVRDLTPRLDLREDVAVVGEDVRAEVHAERLAAWAEAPRALPAVLVWPALVLAAAAVTTLVGWFTGTVHPLAFAVVVLLEWGFLRGFRDRLAGVVGGVERPGEELLVLAHLLARLEREPFSDARLLALRAALAPPVRPEEPAQRTSPPVHPEEPAQRASRRSASEETTLEDPVRPEDPAQRASRRVSASHRIAHLGRIVGRAGWASNQFFAPFGFLLLWRLQAALAVERWREAHGRTVRAWIAAVSELEALSSLAGHAFLHPRDPFPELAEAGAVLEAEALGHPLLPEAQCVPNDVRLGPGVRLLVVSGSNMSGKSTLLRTVGANAVLALAGAPVRARRLRLSVLQPGATLRIQDSLAEGRSRFYAEITRLRALLDLAGRTPAVLFLLDELLAGTNSRDRRIGAEAVLKALLARGAIGMVTTHDLALSELASVGEAANAHFEDELRDGQVVFDYRLRPGVVTRSNALALMRTVGLDV